MRTQTHLFQKKEALKTVTNTKWNVRKRIVILSLFGLLCFTSQSAFSQETPSTTEVKKSITVKGIVSDIDGPLLGSNIILKDTSIGITADDNGEFTFPNEVTIGDTLIFSSLGYKNQEVIITEATQYLNINLEFESLTTVLIALNDNKPYRTKRN